MTSSTAAPVMAGRSVSSRPPLPNSKLKSIKPNLIGSTLVAVYIFLLTGRALDLSPLHVLHIPLLMLILLTITMISRGDLQHSFSDSMTRYFGFFTLWVIICYPFSTWRFASMPSVQLQVQAFVIFLIIVQIIRSKRDYEKVAGAYAYAILAAALFSFHYGRNVEGRIALAGGTLGDPNEFALHLVVGLPFWWFKASRATGFRKALFFACTLPIFYAFARAGSRAGLLALGVLFLITFIFAQGSKKVLLAVVAVVGVASTTVFLPGYVQARFLTFFTPQEGTYDTATRERIESDIASSNERKALLMQSISMTLHHPIVGVGPGDFSFVAWDERKAETGMGGDNLVSHNTYTQISSETGFPGFFLFFTTVILGVRYSYSDFRRLSKTNPQLAQYGRYLFSALAALSVGIFFLSVGYTHLLGIMFAFTLAFRRMVATLEEPVQTASTLSAPKPLSAPVTARPRPLYSARTDRPRSSGLRSSVQNQIQPPQFGHRADRTKSRS